MELVAVPYTVNVVGLVEVVNGTVIGIPPGFQEIQPGFEDILFNQELILTVFGILALPEVQFILAAHHDGLFRTDILTETTENAPEHIDLKYLREPLFWIRCF